MKGSKAVFHGAALQEDEAVESDGREGCVAVKAAMLMSVEQEGEEGAECRTHQLRSCDVPTAQKEKGGSL